MALILGIESSCDETAAAVVEDGRMVRSNIIASQHELHRKFGGVVPEIASRAHLERIGPVLDEALAAAGVGLRDVDAIAVGNRPGLIGSLLVGVSAAKALAWATGKPLIGVDHVRAHLYAGVMEAEGAPGTKARSDAGTKGEAPPPHNPRSTLHDLYPALGLAVSGGHTSLYELDSPLETRVLGRTIDDAVGEAYDKAAVILDVGYPGGPKLDKLAQAFGGGSETRADLPDDCRLPISLLGKDSLDFSFSGLKTALLYKVRGTPHGRGAQATFERSVADLTEERRGRLAWAFQQAAIGTLLAKLARALDQLAAQGRRPRSLLIGGGVSANSLLRRRVLELGRQRGLAVPVPAMRLCLDNAAMIAGLAYEHFREGRFDDLELPVVATAPLLH